MIEIYVGLVDVDMIEIHVGHVDMTEIHVGHVDMIEVRCTWSLEATY